MVCTKQTDTNGSTGELRHRRNTPPQDKIEDHPTNIMRELLNPDHESRGLKRQKLTDIM